MGLMVNLNYQLVGWKKAKLISKHRSGAFCDDIFSYLIHCFLHEFIIDYREMIKGGGIVELEEGCHCGVSLLLPCVLWPSFIHFLFDLTYTILSKMLSVPWGLALMKSQSKIKSLFSLNCSLRIFAITVHWVTISNSSCLVMRSDTAISSCGSW